MSRMALAPGRAREYETIYILRPTVDKEAVDTITTRTIDAVKAEHGHLTEMELWGRRRLAYPIQRHRRGVYVYMKYLGRGNVVSELERQLRLADSVIRYQTILVRNNVPFEGVALPEAKVDLEAELPPEADEPELSRERELGLEGGPPDRDRRGRREERAREEQRGPADLAADEDEGAEEDAAAGESVEAEPHDGALDDEAGEAGRPDDEPSASTASAPDEESGEEG